MQRDKSVEVMKKYEKVLILKDLYNDFEKYYMNNLNNLCDTLYYYNSANILRKFWTKYKLPFENMWYGDWKYSLDKYDLIIVFDCIKSSKIIRYLSKKAHSNCRIIYWHWNPIKSHDPIIEETDNICENWTFNPVDAQKYNMHLNNQFFFWPSNDCIQRNDNGVFYIGADKGRKTALMEIAKLLQSQSIKTDFYIINSSIDDMEAKYIHLLTTYMNYSEVINKSMQSSAIIELLQNGQNGFTARTLEALFFKKKLITNNVEIKKYPFYKKENIFIWGLDEPDMLIDFLKEPYVTIDSSLLFPYSAEGWISNFMK